ncbi:peptidoglycan-binding protein [Streptomyces sp. NPDC057592]|uniref:peptidoglycan-binding protein n=1 Tax=unclassified Streptomyces TaxID=2593676 RepID=UPI0036C8FD21
MTDDEVEAAEEYAGRPGTRRRGRGPVLIAGGFVLVAAVSVVGALGLGGSSGVGDGDGAARSRSSQVVKVGKGTLTRQTEIDGRLGHGPEVPFPVKAEGTVTWLPQTGRTVRRGETVLRVDDRSVVLLYGSLPMYRDLDVRRSEATGPATSGSKGAGADSTAGSGAGTGETRERGARVTTTPLRGMDVKQFEANLSALGYTGFTVDESYTRLTADAVKRWQGDLGLPRTGRVDAGDIVYAPGAVRVAGTSVRVGAAASGNPLSYTSTARMVTVNAPATDMSWATTGSVVTVGLPDGRSVKGEVASVGKDAFAGGAPGDGADAGTGGGDGGGDGGEGKAATVAVVITFDDQGALGRLQSGPVTVRYVEKQRKDVLNVTVAALVALAEGGYGLEVPGSDHSGSGSGRFIPVRTGLFAGGQVEVSGPGVHEGMKVRIPK